MSFIRICGAALLAGAVVAALPSAEALAQDKKCTTQKSIYRCVFKVSELVEMTTTSPGEKAPINGIVIVADANDETEKALNDIEFVLSTLLPSTTEVERRDTMQKLIEALNKRPKPRFKLATFEFWSSDRNGKFVIEGKAFR